MIFLSVAVLLSAPLALVGLAALAFAEERIEVGPDAVTIRTTVFERTRTRRIPRGELECWRETLWPLPPVVDVGRHAARGPARRDACTRSRAPRRPREKRAIGLALAAATGKPLDRRLRPPDRAIPLPTC